MKKKSSSKATRKIAWDPQKDSIFKQLACMLGECGYSVRREDLKQGHGWRTLSGSCRLEEQKLIFVDRRLPQDEQITFLTQRMTQLGLKLSQEKLAELPEKIRGMLEAPISQIAA